MGGSGVKRDLDSISNHDCERTVTGTMRQVRAMIAGGDRVLGQVRTHRRPGGFWKLRWPGPSEREREEPSGRTMQAVGRRLLPAQLDGAGCGKLE